MDVLCLDKTGTITEGRMELHDVVPLGEGSRLQAEQALGALAGVQDDGGPTMDAVRRRYPPASGWSAVQTVPFSSEKNGPAPPLPDAARMLGAPGIRSAGQYRGG